MTNYPWKDAIINFVQTKNSYALRYAIEEIIDHYPKPALDVLMNLLDSHDTGTYYYKSMALVIRKLFPLHERPTLELTGAERKGAIQKLKITKLYISLLYQVFLRFITEMSGMQGFVII